MATPTNYNQDEIVEIKNKVADMIKSQNEMTKAIIDLKSTLQGTTERIMMKLDELEKKFQDQQQNNDDNCSEIVSEFSKKQIMTETDPLSLAVCTNSLIMGQIFKMLDFETLKSSRLVCNEWNNQATKVLSNTSLLDVKKVFSYCTDESSNTIPKLNVNLVGNVYCDFYGYESERDLLINPLQQLGMFCKKFKNQIKRIRIDNYCNSMCRIDDELTEPLHQLLTEICMNVEILELYYFYYDSFDVNFSTEDCEEFFDPLKLKSIVLGLCSFDGFKLLIPFLNKLLAASPSLMDLYIYGNYYPDLSLNPCLRKLIVGNSYSECSQNAESFDLQQLVRMIKKVSKSLEYLELTTFESRSYIERNMVDGSLILPQMLKLTTFINDVLIWFPMPLQTVNNFPNLIILKLGRESLKSTNPSSLDKKCHISLMFNDAGAANWMKSHPHLKLSSLELGMFEDVSVINVIANCFPNLRKLKFTFGTQYENLLLVTDTEKQEIQDKFESVFEACSRLRLDDLSVSFIWKFDLGSLAHVFLKHSKIFKVKEEENTGVGCLKEAYRAVGDVLDGKYPMDIIKYAKKSFDVKSRKYRDLTCLKTLRIGCNENKTFEWDLKRHIERIDLKTAFFHTKTLDYFEVTDFHIDPSDLDILSKFITKMNLPVKFRTSD